jgi:hypothetical protein
MNMMLMKLFVELFYAVTSRVLQQLCHPPKHKPKIVVVPPHGSRSTLSSTAGAAGATTTGARAPA